ncbi:DUF1697 domain-containing protein [Nocardioides sp. JQ2195]|uniref:DUF1697 domain-containing protein n=1 Tax=Nocardioides sp. JQ2195 TaxID=2592334 RepID=UPI00143E5277|nr:DUF1697 domain-containing protein [Nocardioides sp. JQ2195]QIX26004.1 DUF1697 domain-containing protein [Nocardioides sp. JQ2195]
MPSYVAFLRAINLGANRKFPKDAIRAAVEGAGCTDVETHINTGNVRLTTSMRSRARIETTLEDAFLTDRGFEVPTIVFPTAELAQVGRDAEELNRPDLARHYIWLLKDEPSAEVVDRVHALDGDGHRAVIRGRACHLLLAEGYEQGAVDPLRTEKLLGVATNRNFNVVTTLARKWC